MLEDAGCRLAAQLLLRRPAASPAGLGKACSAILMVPRNVLSWQEKESPWRHLAVRSETSLEYCSNSVSDMPDAIAAGPLAGTRFYRLNAASAAPSVVTASFGVSRVVLSNPSHGGFRSRFDATSVLVVALYGETLQGSHFALDRSLYTTDGLVIGEIVAQKIAGGRDGLFLVRKVREMVAVSERMCFARDLHDGVLQSLTAAALRLEVFQGDMGADQLQRREHMEQIQNCISPIQRDLHIPIQEPISLTLRSVGKGITLQERLASLAEHLRR